MAKITRRDFIKFASMTGGASTLGLMSFQIIFFQDKRALEEFISGNFEFGAQVTAVAITASAQASASTTGSSTGGSKNATTKGKYTKGMATFTVAKGGLMYEATVGGQKFSYKAK